MTFPGSTREMIALRLSWLSHIQALRDRAAAAGVPPGSVYQEPLAKGGFWSISLDQEAPSK